MTRSNVPDSLLTYREPPALIASGLPDVIRKTDHFEEGEIKPAPVGTDTRLIRVVSGKSLLATSDSVETGSWLEMPGVTTLIVQGGWAAQNRTDPSALALLSAAIFFAISRNFRVTSST